MDPYAEFLLPVVRDARRRVGVILPEIGEVVLHIDGMKQRKSFDQVMREYRAYMRSEPDKQLGEPCAYCDKHVVGDVCRNCGARR